RWLRMGRDVLGTSRYLLRLCRLLGPTHVFLPEFLSALRYAPALALLRLRGVRAVLRLGNAPDPGRFYRRLWRFAIAPSADLLVANSHFTEHAALAAGVPAH